MPNPPDQRVLGPGRISEAGSAGQAQVVAPTATVPAQSKVEPLEAVQAPSKVMRIGAMIRQLLEEARHAELDPASRERLREIYETSVDELRSALSQDLQDELGRLTHPFAVETPSGAELRVAKAQLVGWLEGLFHGIQATLFAQQMAARQQLEEMRRGLPSGAGPSGAGVRPEAEGRPGTYL